MCLVTVTVNAVEGSAADDWALGLRFGALLSGLESVWDLKRLKIWGCVAVHTAKFPAECVLTMLSTLK